MRFESFEGGCIANFEWIFLKQYIFQRKLVYARKELFYLRLYGVGHMVKGHSDSERGNPLPPLHGLIFPISSKDYFICTIQQT